MRKDKVKQKSRSPKVGPSSPALPLPTHPQTKTTPQTNESIISEAIFGIDVSVTEIEPRQEFWINLSEAMNIAVNVYDSYRANEPTLDRRIAREEVMYYVTALLQLRRLEIKAKQGDTALNSAEKDMRKAVEQQTFNVPKPLHVYLQQITFLTCLLHLCKYLEDIMLLRSMWKYTIYLKKFQA